MFSNTGVNGFLRVLQQASPSKEKAFLFSAFIKRVLPQPPQPARELLAVSGDPESAGVWGPGEDKPPSASPKCGAVIEFSPAPTPCAPAGKCKNGGESLSTSGGPGPRLGTHTHISFRPWVRCIIFLRIRKPRHRKSNGLA